MEYKKTPCAYHDAHKALEWGLRAEFQTDALMQEVYVAIAACCKSYKQLTDELTIWLGQALETADCEQLPEPDDLRELWTALRAPEDIVELIVDLRLCVRGDRLLAWGHQPLHTVVGKVARVIFTLWRFRVFSGSRWVAAGSSCRHFISALLTGLGCVARSILGDVSASHFHLNGFGHLSLAGKAFVGACALAAFPTEALLLKLMDDNRVMKIKNDLLASLRDSMDYPQGLRPSTWVAIGSACGMEGPDLRSKTLAAAHVSVSFANHRIFTQTAELPWSFMDGDIGYNLETLSHGAEPAELVAAQMYRLMALGRNREDLIAGLRLAREAPWGTKVAEEIHASAACFKRFHLDVGAEAIRVRALIHCVRRLNPAPSVEDKHEAGLRRQLEMLEARRPQNTGDWQLLVQDVSGIFEKWKAEGREMGSDARRDLFRRSHRLWQGLSDAQRRSLERKTFSHVQSTTEQIVDAIEVVETELKKAMQRREVAAREPGVLQLSVCKWGAKDLAKMQALYDSPAFAVNDVLATRRLAERAPEALGRDAEEALAEVPIFRYALAAAQPPWLATICKPRDFFRGAVLVFEGAAGDLYYVCTFARQSPGYHAEFSQVYMAEAQPQECVVTSDNWEDLWMEPWGHRFEVDCDSSLSWDKMPRVALGDMGAISDAFYIEGNYIVSDSMRVIFADYVAGLPPPKEPAEQSARPNKASGPRPAWLE